MELQGQTLASVVVRHVSYGVTCYWVETVCPNRIAKQEIGATKMREGRTEISASDTVSKFIPVPVPLSSELLNLGRARVGAVHIRLSNVVFSNAQTLAAVPAGGIWM